MCKKLIYVLVICISAFSYAQDDEIKLSLDKLFNLKVTSVSGTAMDMKKSPAAIYVITPEDFKEQGHRTIADALRAVPGFHVRQIDSSKFAISARGFSDRFADKLLVLIDGRSVYTPLFSGVYWEIQDMILEDINRIEVIRGPGATLWGANAVNGVINIVTKGARETHGGHARVGIGNADKSGEIRWGDQLSEDLFYRLSFKGFEREEYKYEDGTRGVDSWDSSQFNLRTDWYVTAKDTITTIANVQEFRIGSYSTGLTDIGGGFVSPIVLEGDAKWYNKNFQIDWNRAISASEGFSLKSYYDITDNRGLTLEEERHTFDIDFRHWFSINDTNDFIWGLNYRTTSDDIENSYSVGLYPDHRRISSYSGFLQNTTQLNEQWAIMLGSKIGYNDQTEFEIQPSARLTYEHSEDTTFWASWSRAVRTPARTDDDLLIRFPFHVGGGNYMPISISGDRDTPSEELYAYEMGMRQDYLDKKLTLDLAVFYNDYDSLSSFGDNGDGNPLTQGRLDDDKGESYGVEASVKVQATDDLDFVFNYTWFRLNLHGTDEDAEDQTPENLLFTQMNYQITENLGWHTTAMYSDHIAGRGGIHSYITLDTGIIWKVNEKLDVAIWGKNLLDPHQSQYNETTFSDKKSDVPSSVFAELTYKF